MLPRLSPLAPSARPGASCLSPQVFGRRPCAATGARTRRWRGEGAGPASLERRGGAKAEAALGAPGVEQPPRLTARLGRVPDDAARVADGAGDDAGEIADADLVAGADVHRLRALVSLRREHDSLGRIFDVEKLARRRAVAPQHHLAVAAVARLDELADHGRNDVARPQGP